MNDQQSVIIITRNERMRSIIAMSDRVAESDASVLLVGETGVGKEIFAEYIHRISNRSTRPFVKIGLSSLPPDLMSSELFGYEKGSFTSASAQKKGLFEVANTGSIFLDDIDDVPLDIQAKLLRVLESRELMHVGGTVPIPIDVRLISASKVDLKTLVDKKLFRDDLYYRLNVVPIEIPALRERSDDIPVLIEHFLNKYAAGRSMDVSTKAMDALTKYCWPGNIRELRNLVQRLALIADKQIELMHLPSEIVTGCKTEKLEMTCSMCFKAGNMPYNELVRNIESNIINEVLKRSYGNQSEAARILGLSLSTLRDKMKKLNLDPHASKSQQN